MDAEDPPHSLWCACSQCSRLSSNPLTRSRQRRNMEWESTTAAGAGLSDAPPEVTHAAPNQDTPSEVLLSEQALEAMEKELEALSIPSPSDFDLVFLTPPRGDTILHLDLNLSEEDRSTLSQDLTLIQDHPNNRAFLYARSTLNQLFAQFNDLAVIGGDTQTLRRRKSAAQMTLGSLATQLDEIQLLQWVGQGQRAQNTASAQSNQITIIATGESA